MLAIAYVSSAAAPLGDADLARIVETSRVANAASGITGPGVGSADDHKKI